MHLIETDTLKIHEFVGNKLPPYVILSHTWGDDEVSFQDMVDGKGQAKAGYEKITRCCQKAQQDGFAFAWVDTCCIDKKSSAELSESINSMYDWYKQSQICYVYLADTVGGLFDQNGKHSYWFTRGWTLQELIAPNHVEFYDRTWNEIGTKISMGAQLSEITGINRLVLSGYQPGGFSVAERFSWAAGRQTIRPEDRAYSLLGLFDINMPLLYGEGEKAFQRLQKKIIKSTEDRSILAWVGNHLEKGDGKLIMAGLLAYSPDDYQGSQGIYLDRDSNVTYQWPPVLTEHDVSLNLPATQIPHSDKAMMTFVDLGCRRHPHDTSSVYVCLLGGRFRVGRLLVLDDQFREEYNLAPMLIRAMSHNLDGPQDRISMSFHFSDRIEHCEPPLANSSNKTIQAQLRFFASSKDGVDRKVPRDPSATYVYSEYSTYNAMSLADFPASQSFAICQGEAVLLRPDLDSSWESDFYDRPEHRNLYTVCVVTLRIRNRVICRVALGALHYPESRPWCIIITTDDRSVAAADNDSDWFRSKIRNIDTDIHVPDQHTMSSIISDGVRMKISVTLKKRDVDNRRPCYNVVISATTVLEAVEEERDQVA